MNWAINRSRALSRLAALVSLAALTYPVLAETIAIYRTDDLIVLLDSEPCKQGAVVNLKKRATWNEKGVLTDGCWGIEPRLGLVLFYFADKTVVGIPAPFFEKAGGT